MSQASAGATSPCAVLSENGVVTHIPNLGPYNTQKLLVFLDHLHSDFIPLHERGLVGPHLPTFVIVWDNVSFHRGKICGQTDRSARMSRRVRTTTSETSALLYFMCC